MEKILVGLLKAQLGYRQAVILLDQALVDGVVISDECEELWGEAQDAHRVLDDRMQALAEAWTHLERQPCLPGMEKPKKKRSKASD